MSVKVSCVRSYARKAVRPSTVNSKRCSARLSDTGALGEGGGAPIRIPVSIVLAGASLAGNVSSSASSSSRSSCEFESATLHRPHERRVDHVLGHEADLQLVAPTHVADEKVV